MQVVAALTVALLASVVAFQLALAAGAPWGSMAYGGLAASADGALPRQYRLGSGAAAAVLLSAIWVVLASAAIVGRGPFSFAVLNVILWCLAALFALNTVGNARGRHPVERWGAGTVTAVLAVLCAVLAAS